MEEDILQRVIQEIKTYGDLDGIEDIRPLGKAIENLIARNKELEDENKELKKMEDLTYEALKNTNLIHKNYIPKSKVREKIGEIDKILDRNLLVDRLKDYFTAKKEVLQELLQEGDK